MSVRDGNNFVDENGFYKEKDDKMAKEINYLIELWNDFLISQGLGDLENNKDYFIHKRNIYEIVKRLDKRKTYYYVFHGIEEICEYKELGILGYWINTLKPFMVVNDKCKIYNSPNEMFSLYVIVSGLAGIHQTIHPKTDFKVPDERTIQDYVYNFKYCDLDREAMIFFVETLAKSYGIGMETNASIDKHASI